MFNNLYQKYFINPIFSIVGKRASAQVREMARQLDSLKLQNGKLLCKELFSGREIKSIRDAEFQIFSQWGDDGIIQYLISKTSIQNETFIEFGVQDYTESNTRFLLMNDNWKGLLIDSGETYIKFIKEDTLHWRHDLTAVCAFITTDNVNSLFTDNGFKNNIGLLSIDIDGNDYWVWEKIHSVDPDIVIVEYNSVFGSKHAVAVPYTPEFVREKAHFSYLYWGCSLKALCNLAETKGYIFVGCNSNGNNAFFVKKGKSGNLKPLTCEEGYVESKFRDSRNEKGELSFTGGKNRAALMETMPVIDLETGRQVLIKDIL